MHKGAELADEASPSFLSKVAGGTLKEASGDLRDRLLPHRRERYEGVTALR